MPVRARGVPQIVIIRVDLPAPLEPMSVDDLALLHIEFDALQGLDLAVEGLDAAYREEGFAHLRAPFFRAGDFFAATFFDRRFLCNGGHSAFDYCLGLFLVFDAEIGADDGRIIPDLGRRAIGNLRP